MKAHKIIAIPLSACLCCSVVWAKSDTGTKTDSQTEEIKLSIPADTAICHLPKTSFLIEYSLKETFSLTKAKDEKGKYFKDKNGKDLRYARPRVSITDYKITPTSSTDHKKAYFVDLEKINNLTLSKEGYIGEANTSDTGGGYQLLSGLTSALKVFTAALPIIKGGEEIGLFSHGDQQAKEEFKDLFPLQTALLGEIANLEKSYLDFLKDPDKEDAKEVAELMEKAIGIKRSQLSRSGKLVLRFTPSLDNNAKNVLTEIAKLNWTHSIPDDVGKTKEISWKFTPKVEATVVENSITKKIENDSELPLSIFEISDSSARLKKRIAELEKEMTNPAERSKSEVRQELRQKSKELEELEEKIGRSEKIVFRIPAEASLKGTLNLSLEDVTEESDPITTFEHQKYPIAQLGVISYIDYSARAFEKRSVGLKFDPTTGGLLAFSNQKQGPSEAIGSLATEISSYNDAVAKIDEAKNTELKQATKEAELAEAKLRKKKAEDELAGLQTPSSGGN